MNTKQSSPIGPLYHGTRAASARRILRHGFRRAASPSHTGTGICLSESLGTAYEYGPYESGGCVLEAWLTPWARCADRITGGSPMYEVGQAWDQFFIRTGNDAVRTCGGNVWVVWNLAVLVSIRRLSHREAIRGLCRQFDADGLCCYNGVADDYASIWWGQQEQSQSLMRSPDFPENIQALQKRLQRFVGRSQSARIDAQGLA
jgi:hypothetical protein